MYVEVTYMESVEVEQERVGGKGDEEEQSTMTYILIYAGKHDKLLYFL